MHVILHISGYLITSSGSTLLVFVFVELYILSSNLI